MRKSIMWVLVCMMIAVGLVACGSGGSTPAPSSTSTYSISGSVISSGTGLPDVTVTLDSSATATTDASGNYSFTGLANGSYTLTPSKSGYTFTPTSSDQTVSGVNITGVNFAATHVVSTASLSGTFKFISQGAGFALDSGPSGTMADSMVHGYSSTWTFDGAGNCTITENGGTEYDMFPTTNTITTRQETLGTGTCTYSVAADGTITVPLGGGSSLTMYLSTDGNTFIAGGWPGSAPVLNGGAVAAEQIVAVKHGTTMSTASLTGTFKFISQSAGFALDSGPSGTMADSMVHGYSSTWTFDGAGNCTITENGGTEYDMFPTTNTITTRQETLGTGTCTYSVAADGTITVPLGGGSSLTMYLSTDGNTFIAGGWPGSAPVLNGGAVAAEQIVAVKLR